MICYSTEQLADFFDVEIESVNDWMRKGCPFKVDSLGMEWNTKEVSAWLRKNRMAI